MCDIIVIVYLRITCKNENQNIFLLKKKTKFMA